MNTLLLVASVVLSNNVLSNSKFEKLKIDLPSIVSSMNKEGLSSFETTKVEYSSIAKGNNRETYYYFDLKGSNGFLTIDEDMKIVFWKDKGDFPSIRNREGELFYSEMSFFDSDGNRLLEHVVKTDNWISESVSGSIAAQYPGVIEYDGISSLLNSKYSGHSWSLASSGKLPGLNPGVNSGGYEQSEESVYGRPGAGSEGNCGIVSISNALQYYSRYGNYPGLPAHNALTAIYPSIDEPEVVAAAASESPAWAPISEPRYIHSITATIRGYAVALGYTTGGMNNYMTSHAYLNTATDYGYTGTFQAYENGTLSIAQIKSEIDDGHPMQFRTGGDVCYHNHGLMTTGYRVYEAEEWIQVKPNLSIYAKLIIPFLSIYDGHSKSERWYDLTSLGNLGNDYSRAESQSFAVLHLGAQQ